MTELRDPVDNPGELEMVEDVESADICTRCLQICWAGINTPTPLNNHDALERRLTIEPSSCKPWCRMCRLLIRCYPQSQRITLALRPIKRKENVLKLDSRFVPLRLTNATGESRDDLNGIKCEIWVGDEGSEAWTFIVTTFTAEKAAKILEPERPQLASLANIKAVLNTCVEQHRDQCLLRQDCTIRDLKVIDCVTKGIIDAPKDCSYVALSYVWGGNTSGGDPALMEVLPQTIEQSILLTLELGYRYLWIDRYCINQKDAQHKIAQILQMSSIYSSAQLTIVAAAGRDPSHGLPGLYPCQRSSQLIDHISIGSTCLSVLSRWDFDEAPHFKAVEKSVWASRAWTFQEAVCSRRRLIFTEDQVIFSCDTKTSLEWGREIDTNGMIYGNFPWVYGIRESLRPLRPALKTMERYCKREISHESDALDAIVSTLNLVLKDNEYHIWGVPFRILNEFPVDKQMRPQASTLLEAPFTAPGIKAVEICLAWHLDTARSGKRRPRRPHRRKGFPSWSPLGWSSRKIIWTEFRTTQSSLVVYTSKGREMLSSLLLSAKELPAEMPQRIELTLQTATVHTATDESGIYKDRIIFDIERGFRLFVPVYWDDLVDTECDLKIAVVVEDEFGMIFMLLKAHVEHYERIGYSWLNKAGLDTMSAKGILWHPEMTNSSEKDENGWWTYDWWDSFSREYKWWHDYFKEESVVIG